MFRFAVVFVSLVICETLVYFSGGTTTTDLKVALLSTFLLSVIITVAHYGASAPVPTSPPTFPPLSPLPPLPPPPASPEEEIAP